MDKSPQLSIDDILESIKEVDPKKLCSLVLKFIDERELASNPDELDLQKQLDS